MLHHNMTMNGKIVLDFNKSCGPPCVFGLKYAGSGL